MSPNILYQFPMEYITLNSIQLTFLIGLVEFLLINMIFLDKKRIYRFFSRFQLSIQSDDQFFTTTTNNDSRIQDEKRNINSQSSSSFKTEKKSVDESLSSKEVEIVLTRLGMIGNSEAGTFPAITDANYIFNLFEERIPCLDEIKEAFDVFDENRDGFIDARELQKVMFALGLKEGLMVENCRRMIGMFDENGDGVMDFDEFVKFMETSCL